MRSVQYNITFYNSNFRDFFCVAYLKAFFAKQERFSLVNPRPVTSKNFAFRISATSFHGAVLGTAKGTLPISPKALSQEIEATANAS